MDSLEPLDMLKVSRGGHNITVLGLLRLCVRRFTWRTFLVYHENLSYLEPHKVVVSNHISHCAVLL